MTEPNYAAEMRLPTGKTCADCAHGSLCDGLFGAVRLGFTSCDFWPSRYIAKPLAKQSSDDPCNRCAGTGWLEPIGPCRDGSYITSRECSNCDGTGKNVRYLNGPRRRG